MKQYEVIFKKPLYKVVKEKELNFGGVIIHGRPQLEKSDEEVVKKTIYAKSFKDAEEKAKNIAVLNYGDGTQIQNIKRGK